MSEEMVTVPETKETVPETKGTGREHEGSVPVIDHSLKPAITARGDILGFHAIA